MKVFFINVKLALQATLEYRMDLVWRLSGYFMEISVLYLLWRTILGEHSISSYTPSSLGIYYVLIAFTTIFTQTSYAKFADHILEGFLTVYLVKPIRYLSMMFSFSIPEKIIITGIAGVVLVGLKIARVDIPFHPQSIVFGCIALLLASGIAYFVAACIGSLAFWFYRVHGFEALFNTFGGLFSGALIPMDVLPGSLQRVSYFLPFRWMVLFPVQGFLGQLSLDTFLFGLGMQFFWLLFFGVLVWCVRKIGIRQYESAGR